VSPIVLLALGGVALMALRKKGGASGNGGTNGGTNGGGTNGGTTNGGGTNGGTVVEFPQSPLGQPKPGTFYQVSGADIETNGDPLEGIASMAIFGSPTVTSSKTRGYWKCINASPWNLHYYGVESDSPGAVDGFSADLALEQVNYDAALALSNGRWPARAASGGGGLSMAGMGAAATSPTLRSNFGLLWLPPVTGVVQGSGPFNCLAGEWPGGISTLVPPANLLRILTGTHPAWWTPPPPGGLT
jgi:hypothetical protein